MSARRTRLDGRQRGQCVLAGCQRCGSNSAMRLAGCVGNRSSTSRRPWSRSVWRTHRRSVSAVQPILPAIDSMAAHCDGFSNEGAFSNPGAVHL